MRFYFVTVASILFIITIVSNVEAWGSTSCRRGTENANGVCCRGDGGDEYCSSAVGEESLCINDRCSIGDPICEIGSLHLDTHQLCCFGEDRSSDYCKTNVHRSSTCVEGYCTPYCEAGDVHPVTGNICCHRKSRSWCSNQLGYGEGSECENSYCTEPDEGVCPWGENDEGTGLKCCQNIGQCREWIGKESKCQDGLCTEPFCERYGDIDEETGQVCCVGGSRNFCRNTVGKGSTCDQKGFCSEADCIQGEIDEKGLCCASNIHCISHVGAGSKCVEDRCTAPEVCVVGEEDEVTGLTCCNNHRACEKTIHPHSVCQDNYCTIPSCDLGSKNEVGDVCCHGGSDNYCKVKLGAGSVCVNDYCSPSSDPNEECVVGSVHPISNRLCCAGKTDYYCASRIGLGSECDQDEGYCSIVDDDDPTEICPFDKFDDTTGLPCCQTIPSLQDPDEYCESLVGYGSQCTGFSCTPAKPFCSPGEFDPLTGLACCQGVKYKRRDPELYCEELLGKGSYCLNDWSCTPKEEEPRCRFGQPLRGQENEESHRDIHYCCHSDDEVTSDSICEVIEGEGSYCVNNWACKKLPPPIDDDPICTEKGINETISRIEELSANLEVLVEVAEEQINEFVCPEPPNCPLPPPCPIGYKYDFPLDESENEDDNNDIIQYFEQLRMAEDPSYLYSYSEIELDGLLNDISMSSNILYSIIIDAECPVCDGCISCPTIPECIPL